MITCGKCQRDAYDQALLKVGKSDKTQLFRSTASIVPESSRKDFARITHKQG